MNRITKSLAASLSTVAVAAGVTVALSSPAHAEERRCTGTIRAVSIDGDVVVPQGATCKLVGTKVDGSVKVYRNATLLARGIQVNGNVQAENFRRVEVTHRSVDGVVQRSRIGGSIQVKQGGGGEVRRAVVKADIQVFSNDGRWAIYDNAVDGNLQCKSNAPRPVGDRNRVGGNKEDQCETF
ncbi:hypothetical protein [Nocardioides bizhenqiangii]|uniref:DUF3060 domain-containing protein n=1 Tax=Nocardioides bizhenqiangii TaxID=3095076 RepID=A0ABZ0ZPS8_9ACTN|nr:MULTISPECIES: hypothetical protein [unclassified Nocardioides]MDZ5619911.1 hypothetical protein [Nocardioides sp. HM23]WQQ26085.1 hypothetical protein SHK19_19235 [Nocardioides sp. HM61]